MGLPATLDRAAPRAWRANRSSRHTSTTSGSRIRRRPSSQSRSSKASSTVILSPADRLIGIASADGLSSSCVPTRSYDGAQPTAVDGGGVIGDICHTP